MSILWSQISYRDKRRLALWALLALSILCASLNRLILASDTQGYLACAESLASGSIYPTDKNYFGYPLLICIASFFFGNTLLAVHIFPFIGAVFAPLIVFLIAERIFPKMRYVCFCSMLAISFPMQYFAANKPVTEAIVVFFFSFTVYLFQRLRDRSWYVLPLMLFTSWVVLIRYDAILWAVILVSASLLIFVCERLPGKKWFVAGLIGALLIQMPFVLLNRERLNAEAQRQKNVHPSAELSSGMDAFKRDLVKNVLEWEHMGAVTNHHIPLSLLMPLYDKHVPYAERPTLVDALQRSFPCGKGVQKLRSLRGTHLLPGEKILRWANISSSRQSLTENLKRTVKWSQSLTRTFFEVFPRWSFVPVLLTCTGLVVLAGIGWVTCLRRRDFTLMVLLIYFTVYTLIALFYIRGSIFRHMARVMPITVILVTAGLCRSLSTVRSACLRSYLENILMIVILVGCVLFNVAHRSTRPELLMASMWRIVTNEVPLDRDAPGQKTGDTLIKADLAYEELYGSRRLFDREDRRLLEEADQVYIDDFMSEKIGIQDISSTPLRNPSVWNPKAPGRVGIRAGVRPVEVVLPLKYVQPIKEVTISLWAFTRFPQLGDRIQVSLSADRGTTWRSFEVLSSHRRPVKIVRTVREGFRGAREVWVKIRFQTGPHTFFMRDARYTFFSVDPHYLRREGMCFLYRRMYVAAKFADDDKTSGIENRKAARH